jgi:serine acetyltransferase
VVVAAGAVVRGKIPDRCVIAGVPARIVREYKEGDGWSPPSSGPVWDARASPSDFTDP